MDPSEAPIVSIEGCEGYISEFLANRKLKKTDGRQNSYVRKHDKKLAEEVARDGTLRKFRIHANSADETKKCDASFANNFNVYHGDGSVLRSFDQNAYFALNFPKNTQLNRSEFTKLLMNLNVDDTSGNVERWVERARSFVKHGSKMRSLSAPNIRLTTAPGYNRFSEGYDEWSKKYFGLYNVSTNVELPADLAFHYAEFSKSLSLTMSNVCESIDPLKVKTGWQSVDDVLFSTFDQHFYVILKSSTDVLSDFRAKFKVHLSTLKHVPRQNKPEWTYRNVILCIQENKPCSFIRARHVCSRGNTDWFIDIDSGKMHMLRDASSTNVMTMPPQFAAFPTRIFECRFKDMQMNESEMSREIANIRKQGKVLIAGFDHTTRRLPYSIIIKDRTSPLRHTNRSTIKTAIVEISKPTAIRDPLMTSVFCGEAKCTGCWTLSSFQKNPSDVSKTRQNTSSLFD